MPNVTSLIIPLALLVGASSAPLGPQKPTVKEERPGLLAKATISPDSAQRLALGKVPGGKVVEGEIEEEDGKLIYSFDVRVDGKAGYREVHIDARTGEVLGVKQEGGAKEKAKKPPQQAA